MKEKIHCWSINIYIKIDKFLGDEIIEFIKKNYNSFNNFENQTGFSRRTASNICNGFFTNIKKLLELTNLLNFEKKYVENRITHFRDSKTGAYNRTYKNIFPIVINPSIIRIVSHLIGDGTIYEDHLSYGQINSVRYMEKLINSVIEPSGKLKIYSRRLKNKKYFKEIKIPMLFVKMICYLFSIDKKQIKTKKFFEKILCLPKKYRIQTLCALYVDEGSISQRSIRMMDKDIIESIGKLMDSLGYERTHIKKFKFTGDRFGKHCKIEYYGVSMFAEGFKKFYNDVKKSIKKEGIFFGLWQKDKVFEKKVTSYNSKFIEKKKLFIKNKEKSIEIFRRKKILKLNYWCNILNIKRENMCYLVNKLISERKLKRIGRGLYSINGYSL